VERDVGRLGRQDEDNMEVSDRRQVGLEFGQPRRCGSISSNRVEGTRKGP
jgi:hypothetical protein